MWGSLKERKGGVTMRHLKSHAATISESSLRTMGILAVGCALVFFAAGSAQAQTFAVLHSFTGGADGGGPLSGLTMDHAGNLYGTTSGGGNAGQGTVFKLTRKNSGWVFSSLYSFQGGSDGADPEAGVVIGRDGSLYGTTFAGGNSQDCYGPGCGTVFRLTPPPTFCKAINCPWIETVLYRFT